ncbi:MAG: FtsX-like permease family protein [Gemmatimonadota bacterium]|jgi:ABC-type lipoprotein release transport system permease subunit
MIWRIAWRNLWRNRTRTWILSSVIAATYGLSLVGMGIGDDSHQRMLREAVVAAGGDILVHGVGYWDSRGSDVTIPDAATVVEILRGVDGVEAAHPRILVNGLVSTSAASRPVFLQGVEPASEAEFRDLLEDVSAGTFLEEDRRDPLVLGVELAEELELELGDRVVLTASDPEGEVTRALFHLTGILDSGVREADELMGYTTIEAARQAISMDGRLTQVGLQIPRDAEPEDVAARVREALGARADSLEVLTWREAVPEMVGFVELDDAFGYIYFVVIFVVVLFAITNTFLMAVMERVREFGLLSALGLRGRRIGRLLLAETLALTALAMALGFALGFGGHLAANHWGINVAAWGLDEIEVAGVDMADMVIRSTITPVKWIAASIMVAVASVASALYPAWRATRLAPSEAMRFFE